MKPIPWGNSFRVVASETGEYMSDIIRSLALSEGLPVIDVPLTPLDEADLIGLPVVIQASEMDKDNQCP